MNKDLKSLETFEAPHIPSPIVLKERKRKGKKTYYEAWIDGIAVVGGTDKWKVIDAALWRPR